MTCRWCGETKPVTREHWYRARETGQLYIDSRCKRCSRERRPLPVPEQEIVQLNVLIPASLGARLNQLPSRTKAKFVNAAIEEKLARSLNGDGP